MEAHCDKALQPLETRVKNLEDQIKGTVSFTTFSLIVTAMITVLVAMFTWISVQIGNLSDTATATKVEVASIRGKLDPFSIEFKE
jgi:hypothetical protein